LIVSLSQSLNGYSDMVTYFRADRTLRSRSCFMPLRLVFTASERERLGVLVNNISVYGTQIVSRDNADVGVRALANLAKVKTEHDDFLKRLDELARAHGEESPLRLIEDVTRLPNDVAHMLTLTRRCLLVSAFL